MALRGDACGADARLNNAQTIGCLSLSQLTHCITTTPAHLQIHTDNPIYGHYDWYFFLNAGIVTAGLLAFIAVTWKFEERPIAPLGGDVRFLFLGGGGGYCTHTH
jgi:hypothetical protein